MSPEDYQKYKSSFEPTPQKEAVQLVNKTKEKRSLEVPIVLLPPPANEEEEDEEMENEASVTGAGVGDFVAPSKKKKVIKSTFRKRASLRLTETRSSVLAKLGKLSSQDLLKLSEQCSAFAKDCETERVFRD